VSRAVSGSRLGTNRHAFDAEASQTRAPAAGKVFAVGGGFIPTLLMGGGVRGFRPSKDDRESSR